MFPSHFTFSFIFIYSKKKNNVLNEVLRVFARFSASGSAVASQQSTRAYLCLSRLVFACSNSVRDHSWLKSDNAILRLNINVLIYVNSFQKSFFLDESQYLNEHISALRSRWYQKQVESTFNSRVKLKM